MPDQATNSELNAIQTLESLGKGWRGGRGSAKAREAKARASVQIGATRPLGQADLKAYEEASVPQELTQGSVATLRASHHNLARLVAQGVNDANASRITGYSPSRIWTLKRDPAFKQLVEHYSRQVDGAFEEVLGQMALLAKDTLGELQRRLDEDPESLKTQDVISIMTNLLDRTGNGPTHKIQNEHSISSTTLSELKQVAQGQSNGVIIDAQNYQPTTNNIALGAGAQGGLGQEPEEE